MQLPGGEGAFEDTRRCFQLFLSLHARNQARSLCRRRIDAVLSNIPFLLSNTPVHVSPDGYVSCAPPCQEQDRRDDRLAEGQAKVASQIPAHRSTNGRHSFDDDISTLRLAWTFEACRRVLTAPPRRLGRRSQPPLQLACQQVTLEVMLSLRFNYLSVSRVASLNCNSSLTWLSLALHFSGGRMAVLQLRR